MRIDANWCELKGFSISYVIKTFDEVTSLDLPIYLNPNLNENEQSITGILRFVFYAQLFFHLHKLQIFWKSLFLFSILSAKMGPNHRYSGIKPFMELLNDHETAFVYVAEESLADFLQTMAKDFRDTDLMEESLGNQ